ncbi:hypothetical protein ACFY05_32875 [Microtetraspora fusca]|uniref:Uncharacterized protein n=1 Tax=Microtetraspora fusca TaxID=1997 RepID=A0ABW6VGC1_MICFU
MNHADPAQHDVHGTPLAHRLVADTLRGWLESTATSAALRADISPAERRAVEYLHQLQITTVGVVTDMILDQLHRGRQMASSKPRP